MDTLVVGTLKDGGSSSSFKVDGSEDLRSWLISQGLPPCKVILKEKTCHDTNLDPIHYVAASEDIEVNIYRVFRSIQCVLSSAAQFVWWDCGRKVQWHSRFPII